jgi:hypothetical protein
MRMPTRLKIAIPGSGQAKEAHWQEVGDQLIVLGPSTDKVHLLPPDVALVYLACDGQTLMDQVARTLGDDGEQILLRCLEQLEEAQLISARTDGASRRQFLASAVTASAALITSVAMPLPAAAASCVTMISSCPTTLGSCGISCCSNTAAGCTCPGGCGGCDCRIGFECRDVGGTPVSCGLVAAGTLDACQPGTRDVNLGPRCNAPGGLGGLIFPTRDSCADARSLAATQGLTQYSCCQCP